MGYKTDPYQPCEATYLQTRKTLELLLEKNFSASILTKSDLVYRDHDLLQQMDDASVSMSVAFTHNEVRKLFEYNTIDTENRIQALKKIKASGIKTSALLCPIIPLAAEPISLLEKLIPICETIWVYGLSISDPSNDNWKNINKILDQHYPDQKVTIEEIIFNRDHSYWQKLRGELQQIKEKESVDLRIHL